MKVIIVEKERIVALDLEHQVRRIGYQAQAVFISGEELLKHIEHLKPDLVIMDMDLKGRLSGLDAAGMVKENYNIPVVLLTAFLEDLSLEEKRGLLPFGYIVKPFVPRELRLSLEMALYRHGMEVKLKQSEESYRSFFEDDLSANFIAGEDGRVITCNSAFAGMFDYDSPLEVAGINLEDLFYEKTEGESFLSEVISKKRLIMLERNFLSRDGRMVSVVGNFMGQFSDSGRLTGIIGYLHDTTEQKQLEEMLRQSQKMEAVGRLSGGIAHDFNNVLSIILGYTVLIKDKMLENEDISTDLEGIRSATAKAASLTRQLLTFSRRQDLKPVYLELNSLLNELQKMIRRLLGEEIIMRIYLNARESMVYADPGMIEQVILNLAVNARDAMPGGGNLILETRKVVLEKSIPSVMGKIPRGTYVMILVIDTGTGIPPEVQGKIFEPFFTTKPEYQGTGLGLSSAYGIIKQSKGFIRLESEPGKGTTFQIYLPLCEGKEADLPKETSQGIISPAGSEMVLVVEDDKQIREILLRLLSQAGYRPLGVKNAGEALLLCESEPEIRLILTDFMMPYLNGARLISRLKKQIPAMKFILTSGFSETFIREKEKIEPGVLFLMKPLDHNRLLQGIRELLDKD